jgi:2-methylcitrate dehydratase
MEPFGGKGTPFGIERFMLKKYPVRDSCQLVVDAALELREKVSPEEVKSLDVQMFASAMRTAVSRKQLWEPKTRETADHSIPFCLVAALIDGEMTAETFDRKRFLDKDVLDMLSRTNIEENPEFTKQTPGKRNILIEATTKSGEKTVVHRVLSLEDVGKEWPYEQVEAKFLGLVSDILTPAQTEATLEILGKLEDLDDAARILDNLQA